MTQKIDQQDLWKLFLSDIFNLECGTELKNGRIHFNLRIPGKNSKKRRIPPKISKDHRYSIHRSDLGDIKEILNGILQSPIPTADFLLWIFWVREEKFDLCWSPLNGNDELIRSALTLTKQDVEDEKIERALDILIRGEYLHKDGEECQVSEKIYSLTPRGRRSAEKLFMPTMDGRLVYNKSASVVPEVLKEATGETERESIAARDDMTEKIANGVVEKLEQRKPVRTRKPRKKRESQYEHDVEVCLNELVDAVINQVEDEQKQTQLKVEEITATAMNFAKYLKENCAKFKNAEPKNIANSLTNRSDAWKKRKSILAKLYGKEPPPPDNLWEGWANDGDDDAHETNADARIPHSRIKKGYSRVERGRIKCEDEVEECFQKYFLDGKKPSLREVALWINENVPAFKDKDIERIKNGVAYSNAWINRAHYFPNG